MFWSTNKNFLASFAVAFALLFFLPSISYAFFTKDIFVNGNMVSAGYWYSYDFSTPLKASYSVGELWSAKNFGVLYDNLAQDLSGIYTKDEFIESLKDAAIACFEVVGDAVYLNSKQAYTIINIRYLDNSSKNYKTVFNYERGGWRLLGTKEIE